MEQMEPSIIAMLNSIYRAAPAGIGMVRNRVFCQVNDRVCEMTGYSRQELIGQSSRMVYPSQEEFEKVGRDKYEQVQRLGIGSVETRWQRKDGTIIDILLSSSPLNQNDLSEGVVFTATDITERKKAEAALQESEARRRTLIETTATGYLILDEQGKVIDANAEYVRLAGYHRLEEIRGRSVLEWTAEYEKEKNAEAVAQCLRDGYIRNFEIDYVDPQGKITPVEINATVEREGNVRLILTLCRDITERRRAEEEVQKLASVVRHSKELINLAAPDGRMIFLNEAGCALLGINPGDVSKTYILEVIPDHLKGMVRNELLPVLTRGDTWEADLQYRNLKTGDLTDVHAITFPIFDPHTGQFQFFANVSQDITDRKRAEKKLRESEQRFRRIVEASPMGIHLYEIDPAGELILIDANPAADRFTGTRTADLLNLPIEKAFPSLANTDIPKRYKDVALGHAPSFELRDLKYNDPQIHGIFDVHVFQSSPGRMTAMFMEVTDRIQAEKETRLNAQRTLALLRLNQMTTASVREITDFALEEAVQLTESRVGYLAFLNEEETVLSMYSWSRTAMAECSMSDKPIQYPMETTGLWGEAVRQRQPILTNDYPTPNPLKKGYPQGHVPILRHMNVPVFVGNHIVLVAGVGNKEEPYNQTDVQQLTLLMEGMWRLIERQRAEQQREQLLKDLQAKTEELESIIYVSSHDLRSPLVNIQGFSGELGESCRQIRKLLSGDAVPADHQQLDELLGQDIPSAIEYITTSVSKLDALQKGLLKICRIGRETLEIGRVAMNDLINGTLKSTRYQLDNCQAQVIVDPLPNCLADAAQLTQVFTNLIDNAIKYRSPKRPLVIRIYGRVEGDQCVYAIADNGVGIAPEHQQKVFEMFHQLDPLNGPGGEGLGLTIVKRILGRMDGQVRLESAFGVGSVFFIILPKA